jgi:RNA chaperone Hfq
MTDEDSSAVKTTTSPQFIPKLKGKKVLIRMTTGGQPLPGVVEAYNPYEILVRTAKGQVVVFKHAIATIEIVDEPQGFKPDF